MTFIFSGKLSGRRPANEMKTLRCLLLGLLGLSFVSAVEAASPIQSATGTGFSGSRSKGAFAFQSYQTDPFTGRASVTVPIAVPPGRRNLAPDLALQYFSSTANDWLGVGWNLNLGFIQRQTKQGVPRYDASDIYEASFSGVNAELVPIGGNEYRAKVEGAFMRFRFDGTSWRVTDKSGTTYFFGQAAAARQIHPSKGTFRWALERIEDVQGNYLTVSYTTDQGQLYLSRVDYTGHVASATPPRAAVSFALESRPDPVLSYRAGFRVMTAQRLREVMVTYNGEAVRSYRLTYSPSPDTGKSLLTVVTQFGSDGTTSLPSMRFEYAVNSGSFSRSDQWLLPDGAFVSSGQDEGRRLIDVNGDALPELLVAKSTPSNWYVASYKNTGTGFVRDDGWKLPDGNFIFDGKDDGRRLADLNGDAFLDVIIATSWRDASGYVETSRYRASYLNTGSGWMRDDRWLLPDGYFFINQIVAGNDRSRPQGRRMVDVNGDGLADLLVGQDGYRRCYLNTGTGFTQAGWCAPPLDFGTGQDEGVQLADLNGDGLVDILKAKGGVKAAYLNTGADWQADSAWQLPSGDFIGSDGTDQGRRLADINGDGLPDLLIAKDGTKATYMNTGSGWAQVSKWTLPDGDFTASYQDQGRWLADIDADGLTDVIIGNGGTRVTYLNSPVISDLLIRTTNGIGGATALAYTPSSRYFNNDQQGRANLPFPMPTVSAVEVEDGMGNTYRTTYAYENGLFDWNDREFRGFGTVAVTDPEGNIATTQFFQDAIFKGNPQLQEFRDAQGRLLSRTFNRWDSREAFPGVRFAFLVSTDSYTFDASGNYFLTQVDQTYDMYGNVARVMSWGVVDPTQRGRRSGDEKTIITEFAYNTSAWILDRPSHAYALDEQDRVVQEKWLFYDQQTNWRAQPTRGLLTREETWLNTGPPNPATTLTYDAYGNLLSATDAAGRTSTTVFDATDHLFPITITNPAGHTLSATYDPKTGQLLTQTDANNVTSRQRYDVLGRPTESAFVDPATRAEVITAQYAYDLSAVPTRTITTAYSGPNLQGPVISYQFADGLGRGIASRAPAEDPAKHVLQWTRYNFRGQPIEAPNPYTAPAAADYPPPDLTQPITRTRYDALGRPLEVTSPDGTVRSMRYALWTTVATDENGKVIQRTSDAYGRLTQVEEINGASTHTTRYLYDTLNNLLQVTDAKGNVTTLTYDSLSRKTAMQDPDMGRWTYVYDILGNLTQQTDARGVVTTFTYDTLNRLTRKAYTIPAQSIVTPTAAVTYTYDDPAKAFSKGKLTGISDGSGASSFEYDHLGRLVKEAKTIDGAAYTIRRSYDLLGRLKQLTYPDGEAANYAYNTQGGIETLNLQPVSGSAQPIVSNIDYHASGQISSLAYGNGVATDYTYNPQNLRLSSLITRPPAAGALIQDFAYTFDPAGNITAITDRAHTASQTFEYDALHRLTRAVGSYGAFNYSYDAIGNIINKEGAAMSYGLPDGSKPHAVTSAIGFASGPYSMTLIYDANGNLFEKRGPDGELIVRYHYDAENRLTRVIPGPPVVEIALRPGWNFFSVPLVPDVALDEILSKSGLRIPEDVDQLSRYNAQTQRFEHYVGDAKFNQFTALEYARGYLLYVTNPSGVTLRLTGTVPTDATAVPLYASWNLVGHTRLRALALPTGLVGLTFGVDVDQVARYDKTTSTWVFYPGALSQLIPQEGYWVYGLRGTTWNIPAENQITRFIYDGDGGRVKVITPSGTTVFVGSSYEVGPDGTKTKSVFAGSQRVAMKTSTGSLRFFHPDHLGSVNVVTDSTGTVVERLEYTPYGSLAPPSSPAATAASPWRFTGQRLDPTGLYFYNARYYDPQLGRFITPDTLVPNPGNPQDFNRYTYANNNPLLYTDPTGHFSAKKFLKKFGSSVLQTVGVLAAPFTGGASLWLTFGGLAWSGVQAAQAGQFGAWAVGFGASLVLGGLLPTAGFDNFFLQIGAGALRGAAIGAVSGGLASLAGGGSFGQGAGYGALGGAGGGALGAFAHSQQYQNWAAGEGFLSNRQVLTKQYQQDLQKIRALSVKANDRTTITVGSRPVAGVAGHRYAAAPNGNRFEMGPLRRGGPIATSNTTDVSNWDTSLITQNAIAAGAVQTATVNVSASGFVTSMGLYEAYFGGQQYNALSQNSNFAVNSVIYGAGGQAVNGLGFTPSFPNN